MRKTLLVLLFLVASPLLAESADLRVTLDAPPWVDSNVVNMVTATVENFGPDPAVNVDFQLAYGACSKKVVIPVFALHQRETLACEQSFPNTQPFAGASASAHSDTDDPSTGDNWIGTTVRVRTPPILYTYASVSETMDPGLPFKVNAIVGNIAFTEAHDVIVVIDMEDVTEWRGLPAMCTAAGTQVRCSLGTIAARVTTDGAQYVGFSLEGVAPDDPSGRALPVNTIASDAEGTSARGTTNGLMYRVFYVTTTNDSGAGSLRDAITATRTAGCTWTSRCKVSFRIPDGTTPWLTIRPESPLPPIRETVIDGRIQTRFFGDTNIAGPEIELSGERAQPGMAGLQVESAHVFGLSINGFGGPGIFIQGGALIRGNFIGCDPTGMRAVPNERGIVLDNATGSMHVEDNLISGNRRSGIFAYSGHDVQVYSNRIGWNAKGTEAIPNGASGVFLGPGVDGAFVTGNSIAFNAEMGVSIAGGTRVVEMSRNALFANGGLAIDYRLDGVSRSVEGPTAKTFQSPEITTARYDSITDTTVIEGFQPGPHDGFATRTVTLYANDVPDASGFGEGQYLLGEFPFASFESPDNPQFKITLKGRPPGRWISAIVTVGLHYYWLRSAEPNGDNQGLLTTTTEFGATVPCEGF